MKKSPTEERVVPIMIEIIEQREAADRLALGGLSKTVEHDNDDRLQGQPTAGQNSEASVEPAPEADQPA